MGWRIQPCSGPGFAAHCFARRSSAGKAPSARAVYHRGIQSKACPSCHRYERADLSLSLLPLRRGNRPGHQREFLHAAALVQRKISFSGGGVHAASSSGPCHPEQPAVRCVSESACAEETGAYSSGGPTQGCDPLRTGRSALCGFRGGTRGPVSMALADRGDCRRTGRFPLPGSGSKPGKRGESVPALFTWKSPCLLGLGQ